MPNFEVQCKTCKSKTKVNSNVTPIKKGKRKGAGKYLLTRGGHWCRKSNKKMGHTVKML